MSLALDPTPFALGSATSLGLGWKCLIFDDPSPKPLATRTARAGQQYVEGRRGACLEALSINFLSSDSNVGFRAPWDTSENRDVPLTTR